jgi:hypothetical protein
VFTKPNKVQVALAAAMVVIFLFSLWMRRWGYDLEATILVGGVSMGVGMGLLAARYPNTREDERSE